MPVSYDIDVARERIGRVFRYLQELHRVRTPPALELSARDWSLPLGELPRSGFVERGFEITDDGTPTERADRAFVLKVGRPAEPECPEPSVVLKNWLKAGWDRPGTETERFVKKTLTKAGKRQAFEDAEERVDALETWLDEKRAWESDSRAVVDALDLFQSLFGLRARFQRESEKYQLFLADGVLALDHADGRVHHPLLLQRVELRFDAEVPQFTLAESDENPELYTPLLRHAGLDGAAIQAAREEVEREHFHPLGGESTGRFLRDLVQRLWSNGQFLDDPRDLERATGPVIYRAPCLFLGNRSQGLAENLERYALSLPRLEELPESLLRVVGIETEREAGDTERVVEPLLTKEANPEQEQVIRRLEETGAVLVQGPPGTGKSHTIANLVGHLLAQNKSILVTSHTSKALRVVREKLPEPLQPLCVSVLQTDEESSRQLEESISGIVNTLASTSAKKLAREIEQLEARREKLRSKHDELAASLLEAVKGEYEPIGAGAGEHAIAPADAARLVADGASEHDWLPGPLEAREPSLGGDEIDELYRLSHALRDEEPELLEGSLPDPAGFPSAREFASLHDDLADLERSRPADGQDLWQHDDQTSAPLAELATQARDAVHLLHRDEPWLLDCVRAGRDGGQRCVAWLELADQIEACAREIPSRDELVLEHGPEITADGHPLDLAETARAIEAHLASGGRLGRLTRFTRPAWTALIAGARVDGRAPSDPGHFQAIAAKLEIQGLRADLARRWDRQLRELGAPAASELGARPEVKAGLYADQIRTALDWYRSHWEPVAARMAELGLDWERLATQAESRGVQSDLERTRDLVEQELPGALELRGRFLDWKEQHDRKAGWLTRLDEYTRRDAIYAVIKRMKAGIKKGDYDAYAEARTRIEELHERRAEHARRCSLLERLEESAPGWAQAIREGNAPHAGDRPPGEIAPAWRLRVCLTELGRLGRLDPDKLQERLDAVKGDLLEVTAAYVEKLAWRAQLERTGLEQQQALAGWLGLHKKMGKGTGKNVARLKDEARQALVKCRSAVPVWIMPLSRVTESFDLATTRFDVVIIDEASQSDVLGLVAFALGKEVVVVGDHEQVSPYAVGQRGDRTQGLIDEILVDIPNRQLYDGKTSVYDLARQSFGGTIRLLEHFRCVPDIIQFSNDLCYRGEIRPLREEASSRIAPHLVPHRVEAGSEVNGVNEKEALEIGSLVSALCRLDEYADCTIGVICMLGTDQALYIDSVLRRRLSVAEYQRREILCGNASQFQGDERDIIFLSLVSSPSEKGPLPLRQRDDFRKMVNVAASRARDQLWVVHSLDPGRDLKPGDLRQRLIAHAENPSELRPEVDESRQRHGSDLEKRVYTHLCDAGYRLIQNYPVGAYQLDLVVEGGARRVAIQCDGDRACATDELGETMQRQLTLERLGWQFIRVRASQFYRAPERALAKLEKRLAELEIRPQASDAGEAAESSPTPTEALDARVRKRAEQIRARWKDVPTVSSVLGGEVASSEDGDEGESSGE